MEETNEDPNVVPELYFLIAKFLSGGPLKETAKTLLKEIESLEVLPRRLDWEGNEHTQTYDELASQFREMSSDRLVEVCKAALRAWRSPGLSVRRSVLGAALRPPARTVHALPHRLMQRELGLGAAAAAGGVGGPALLTPRALAPLRLQRRTLGHLSAVYCLAFDCTGRYVMTGADDLLVKVWSAVDGRLLGTLRGCGAEVTDACVSADGALLAVGSVERLVRVWELAGGAPRAVLAAHAGTITSVHWAPPARRDLRWLASTSTDGSVAFWTCSPDGQFLSQPVQYVERMRPGACHMICAAWSAGGAFLAAGSADHHVRVYAVQTEPPGPRRVLETAVHSDAVDSIAWAHRALRFVSGSKDGSAALWTLHATQWRPSPLVPQPDRPAPNDKRLKVTMVCWECSDALVLTAVSDCTVRVWCSRACTEVRVLRAHADEAYVLEPHPFLRGVVLSAGHDGLLCVWDAARGEPLASFRNTIEGQGEGALFDAKWASGGASLAATDSHGHLLVLGLGAGHPRLQDLPPELFFHTDYRPLVRDALGGALDEQTMLPPHALPPPFLVDVEGAPHPPALQRLVPGRERAAPSQLQPVEPAPPPGAPPPAPDPPPAPGAGGVWRGGGVRHAGGGWAAPDPLLLPPSAAPMVPPLPRAEREHIEAYCAEMNAMEIAWWRREMRRRPVMISTAAPEGGAGRRRAARPRPARPAPRAARPPPEEAVESSSTCSDTLSSSVHLSERSSESESQDSEWERGAEPPARATRRRARPAQRYSPAPRAARPAPRPAQRPALRRPRAASPPPEPSAASPPPAASPSPAASPPPSPPPAAPQPPTVTTNADEWLMAVTPRKSPYTPQIGDDCVYFRVGHQRYFEAVAEKDIYKVTSRDKPWERMHIYEAEPVKVVGIKYSVRGGVRVASVSVSSGLGARRGFTVRYHDMPDVIDFLVLRAQYEAGVARRWAPGDRFHCAIDDRWWRGEVLERAPPASPPPPGAAPAWAAQAARHFLSVRVRWDNGELERLSPWDLEPLGAGELAPPHRAGPADWGGAAPAQAQAALAEHTRQVMSLAAAEPFLAPPAGVAYPLDLTVICARFERRFYRRAAAAAHDAQALAANAARGGSERLARDGRLVADLLLACIERWRDIDVLAEYRALSAAAGASGAGAARRAGGWQRAAQDVLDALCASPDAAPFMRPVSPGAAPDYRAVVARPMDLGTVRARLAAGRYGTPDHCCADLRRIFTNSRLYNTNKRSRIYSMTVRLSSLFESLWARLQPTRPKRAAALARGRRRSASSRQLSVSSRQQSVSSRQQSASSRRSSADSDSSSWSEPLATTSRRQRAHTLSTDSDQPLQTHRKGKGVGKKSKSSSASNEPVPTTSAARQSASPEHPPDDEEYVPIPNGDEFSGEGEEDEYSQIEVLEEELPEEDVDLTYTDNSEHESRPVSRSQSRKRGLDSDSSYGRKKRSRRRHSKRPRERVSRPPSSSSASESAWSSGRYESDRSYKPRYDSDDDRPLHLYKQRTTPADDPEAGPSTATHNGHNRRGRVSLRARRSPRRYNEDSEEDSAAVISKRSQHHHRHQRLQLQHRRQRHAQSGSGGTSTGHNTDHTYFNGHVANHNGHESSASTSHQREEPPAVSVSSRGRVRKLTAKARGLLRD